MLLNISVTWKCFSNFLISDVFGGNTRKNFEDIFLYKLGLNSISLKYIILFIIVMGTSYSAYMWGNSQDDAI